jgi:hypothetical protein
LPVPEDNDLRNLGAGGLVPAAVGYAGVTELRVHGVGGATPQALLGDLAPQQVAGDRVAGFYRTADRADRHVEAYSWGGLTSRSGVRALWVLLLPFALANLAGWMAPRGMRASRLAPWFTASVRLLGLALTVNLLVMLSMLTADVLSYQCGADAGCSRAHWWSAPLADGPIAGHPARTVALGMLPPLLALVLLAALSARSRRPYDDVRAPHQVVGDQPDTSSEGIPAEEEAEWPSSSAASLSRGLRDRNFWHGGNSGRRLTRLQLGGSLAVLALLLDWTATSAVSQEGLPVGAPAARTAVLVVAALVLLGVGVELCRDPRIRPGEHKHPLPSTAMASGGLALLGAVTVAVWQPAFQPMARRSLPGLRLAINVMFGAEFVLLVVVLALLAPACRRAWSARRDSLGPSRPVTFGPLAPFVASAVAILLLDAGVLGFLVRGSALAGPAVWSYRPQPRTGEFSVVLFPMVRQVLPMITLLPIVALLLFAGWQAVRLKWATRLSALDAIHAQFLPHAAEPPPGPAPSQWWIRAMPLTRPRDPRTPGTALGWLRTVARARRIAQIPQSAAPLLTGMALTAGAVVLVVQLLVWGAGSLPPSLAVDVGTAVTGVLPLAVVYGVRRGYGDLATRRRLGILWDVGTFWPRAFHPFAPPSYAERAVPDLQRRIWWLHDHDGQVVLAAHSQGSLVAAAALLQPEHRPVESRAALVTFGSPLMKLYGWGFPDLIDADVLADLAPQGRAGVIDWRNVVYESDYIGGPVGVVAADGRPVDHHLLDPPTCWHVYGEPEPKPLQHSGYWTDVRMWAQVDALVEAVRPRPAPQVPPGDDETSSATGEGAPRP